MSAMNFPVANLSSPLAAVGRGGELDSLDGDAASAFFIFERFSFCC
eukprot:CAMPEP_0171969944 /NCGR_PEP_ID=MMETSP0993-20121228/211058_1 /TAXON_ID=483369 /ORGANISM="non described non described, Strain CCMP2098" /LENGTH=45 /DNA_ID= /DNA_START= /DNA_END= /DNA_ORIENTATION=